MSFMAGDKVQLKSGSVVMVVQYDSSEHETNCIWMDGSKVFEHTFMSKTLGLCGDDEPKPSLATGSKLV